MPVSHNGFVPLCEAHSKIDIRHSKITLPPFKSKKFHTQEEYDAWRREYLIEIARNGGVKWLSEVRGAGIFEFTPKVEEIFFKEGKRK